LSLEFTYVIPKKIIEIFFISNTFSKKNMKSHNNMCIF
jgi:hypothetical protein